MPEKILEPLRDEPVQVMEALARIAEVKVLLPATAEPVDLFQRIFQRSSVPASGECPDFVLEVLDRLVGRGEIQISPVPSIPIPVIPQSESEKVQAFACSLHPYNLCFLPINHQSQFALQPLFEPSLDPSTHASGHNHEIIRIADEPGVGKPSWGVGIMFKGAVQLMKVDVREQGKSTPPCGVPFSGRIRRVSPFMVDGVEVTGQVRVINLCPSGFEPPVYPSTLYITS